MSAGHDANVLGAPFRRFYGKYRGKCTLNVDPLMLGRILAEVAAVPAALDNWCMPCVPYAGIQVGFYNMPDIGANVWIEFEGGDPMRPIWSGCFWGEGELMEEFVALPTQHVWKTKFITMQFDDTLGEGGIKIICSPPAVATPLTMTFNSAGIVINAEPAIISMITEEGITLTYPPGVIAMTAPAIEIEIAPTTTTFTEESIAIESPTMEIVTEAAYTLEAGAEIGMSAGAAMELSAGAEMAVSAAAALEATAGAEMAITSGAALEITAGAAIAITAPALEITAATNVAPALLIDGQVPLVL